MLGVGRFLRRSKREAVAAGAAMYDMSVTQPLAQVSMLQRMANKVGALLGFYLLALIIAGLGYSYFEDKTLWDGFWWASVTATSVGYGDQFPTGVQGRIVGILLMNLVLLFLIPIITARWSAQLIVDSDAFTHQEQEEMKSHIADTNRKIDKIMAHLGLDPDGK